MMVRQPLGWWLFKVFQRRSSLRLGTLADARDVHIPLQGARTVNVTDCESSALTLALFQISLPLLSAACLLLERPVVQVGLAVKYVIPHSRWDSNSTIALSDAVRLRVHHPPSSERAERSRKEFSSGRAGFAWCQRQGIDGCLDSIDVN